MLGNKFISCASVRFSSWLIAALLAVASCKKSDSEDGTPATVEPRLSIRNVLVDQVAGTTVFYNVSDRPEIRLRFSSPLRNAGIATGVELSGEAGSIPYTWSFSNGDTVLVLRPDLALQPLTQYRLSIQSTIRSAAGGIPDSTVQIKLITAIDSTDKFPRVSDDELLTIVQRQTFRFFSDYAHPVSGMIRDRNQNPDLVTTGGTGMGVMAIVTAVHRGFITREAGLEQVIKIVRFLAEKAITYHGAYAHFVNGSTGATIPFSSLDNGADLVETALLMQGLLTARQFFNSTVATEASLRTDITKLFNEVEWSWFRKNNENRLYWHWSPDNNWAINLPISGWNEALIAYVLAAAPGLYTIPKEVYDEGWARSGAIRNGASYKGIRLPLGPALGGPMFLSQYSFLGLDPRALSDAYANYGEQVTAHANIQHQYAIENPKRFNGYSESIWGLTASDNNYEGYAAHSPTNDLGVIAPTAAIASIPYTPEASLKAARFFYYQLGDKIFREYGFIDAFNLSDLWFADSFLAIDQAPQIIMIENYRSGLLWKLFMSCPEVQGGLTKLGFTY